MSILSFIFAVLLFTDLEASIFRRHHLKNHLDHLLSRIRIEHDYPGFGLNFAYFFDKNGKLNRVDLKGNNETDQKLHAFYTTEQKLEDDMHKGNKPKNNAPKKFNFRRRDIVFTLFNRKHKQGIELGKLDFTHYDINLPTKFVTHGFLSSGTSDTVVTIKDNYLKAEDCNVIAVDWSIIADNPLYPIPAIGTGIVADYLSRLIGYLVKTVGQSEDKIHLIGHSLGAQTMGFTGKRTRAVYGFQVHRITGLDPAGPLFQLLHLNKDHAKFVDIIHTDGGVLGLNKTIGHVDFYPNNGDSPQPGCDNQMLLNVDPCSHGKSWQFFAETILHRNKYVGDCQYDNDYKNYPMGAWTPHSAKGICSLDAGEYETEDGNEKPGGFYGLFSRLVDDVEEVIQKILPPW